MWIAFGVTSAAEVLSIGPTAGIVEADGSTPAVGRVQLQKDGQPRGWFAQQTVDGAGEAKDIVVAPDTVCRVEHSVLKCEPSLQALFECRLPNQAAAMARLKGVRAYGLSRKLQTPQALLKPLKIFGQPIREVTLSADPRDPGTVSWNHQSPLSIAQVAKRMGIKDASYNNGDGTMSLSIYRDNQSITLTGNKKGTVVGCGYSEDTGDY